VQKINKSSLKKSISYLFASNILNFGIIFISSILVFRNINRDDYGLYVLILSLFAIVELFMGGYNQSITRFLKENIPEIDKVQIILYTVYYKYFILSIFLLFIFIIHQLDLIVYLIRDYSDVSDIFDKYILIAVLGSVLSVLSGISSTILTALYHYKITNNSLIIKNLCYLISVAILIYFTNDYFVFLYVSLFLNLILFIFLSSVLYSKYPEYLFFRLLKKKLDLGIYKKYLWSYATPLTTISILTYVKNHLPILILGKEFELEDVAIFSIIKIFFKTLHTISGSFLQPLLSKFITVKNESINEYKFIMNKIYYASFFLRIVIYVILLILSDYFFLIYKIEQIFLYGLIFSILGFEFIIAGIMIVYGTILNTNKSSKYLLYTSIIRFIIELLLIYFILFKYGILGASLIFMVSRFIETLSAYYFVKKEEVLKFDYMCILVLIPFIIYFCLKLL